MFLCETCEDVTMVAATVRGIPDTIPCPHCHWLVEYEFTLDGDPLDIEDFLRVNYLDDKFLTAEQVKSIQSMTIGQEMTLPGGEKQTFLLKRIL